MNVPASASPKQQLHYLGLELPEAGAGVRGWSPHGPWEWGPAAQGTLGGPNPLGPSALGQGLFLPATLSSLPLSCVPTQGPHSGPPLRPCWVGGMGRPQPHTAQAEASPGGGGSGGGVSPSSPVLLPGASASCYAQIDLEATAAAHRAGARHAQAREERLAQLDPGRKGAPR